MVGFVKLFRTSVARQVSRKVEPLSTSATARNGEKQEFHHVTPPRETGLVHHCTQVSAKSITCNVGLSPMDVDCDVSTVKLLVFIRQWCQLIA